MIRKKKNLQYSICLNQQQVTYYQVPCKLGMPCLDLIGSWFPQCHHVQMGDVV